MDVILNTAIKYGDIFIMGTKITIFTSLIATFVGLLLGILLALFKMNIFLKPQKILNLKFQNNKVLN